MKREHVKDNYNYWTNIILQNYHFSTPFLPLFRQIFSDFWIFFCKLTPLTLNFRLRPVFTRLEVQKESWTKPSSLLTIFDPRKCLHLPHIVHMTYFWAIVNLGQNSNPKSLFFTFTPCKLMRASKSFQSSSSLLQFSTNELSQTNNRIMISFQWWRHERYLWRHICHWWRHMTSYDVSVSTKNQK